MRGCSVSPPFGQFQGWALSSPRQITSGPHSRRQMWVQRTKTGQERSVTGLVQLGGPQDLWAGRSGFLGQQHRRNCLGLNGTRAPQAAEEAESSECRLSEPGAGRTAG